MSTIFTNAQTARQNTRNVSVIQNEVRAIEAAVLANIDAGVLFANVTSGTAVTDSNVYYKAFVGISNDRTRVNELDFITKHFVSLGYAIRITENPINPMTLSWNISW